MFCENLRQSWMSILGCRGSKYHESFVALAGLEISIFS